MRFVNLACIIYFLKLSSRVCLCGSTKITDGKTLDVAKDPEDSIAQLILEKENGLDGRKFEIKEGVKVTTVTYNGVQVWTRDDRHCTVVTLISKQDQELLIAVRYVKEGETEKDENGELKSELKGCKKDGNQWTEIEESDFDELYKKMQNKPEANAEPSGGGTQASVGSIDVSKPDSTICHAIETRIEEVPSKVFITKPSATVKMIVNGDKNVWVGGTGERCSYSIAFLENGKPKMLFAIFVAADGNESRGFRKYKNVKKGCCGWFSFINCLGVDCCKKEQIGWFVSKKKYGDKINKLKSNTNAPKKFTLDIDATTNNTNCNVTREDKDDLSTLIYATKSGHTIEKVVDNGRDVWSVPDDHICFLCELYSSSDSKLLRLHVKSGNYQFTFHTFESSGGTWNGVDGKEFVGKLEEMRKTSRK